MSALFGKCNFDREPIQPSYLDLVRPLLSASGPDSEGLFSKDNVAILFRGFRTTKESGHEIQPYVAATGFVLVWDGRLDNREELIHSSEEKLPANVPDVVVVAAAYKRWGVNCFSKLIGDWALSIWDPRDLTLVLAKDFVGTRQLYYCVENNQVAFSSCLKPLILLGRHALSFDEEYAAGWLSSYPGAELTPYVAIRSVPPSCFVRLHAGKCTTNKYWDFDPSRRVRYGSDSEYEEHFRVALAESVRRRLRSDAPIIAELSGGMDSSSIVCLADILLERGSGDCPRLDTISYFDDSEPNWDERPYVSTVEEKRGRAGCHLTVVPHEAFKLHECDGGFAAIPGSIGGPTGISKQFAACLALQRNRVLLSGVGGDEVTGGVPTPVPELADLLTRCQLRTFAHQLQAWALRQRRPWFHLLFESIEPFVSANPSRWHSQQVNWLNADFVARQRDAFDGYQSRLTLYGPLPSFQENLRTLDTLRRQFGSRPSPVALFEKRYPYLDRNLVEFLYAIPREQLLRPGQRRSLMRRALSGIVPDEVLNRKRKAYVARSPLTAISAVAPQLMEFSKNMVSAAMGLVLEDKFVAAIEQAGRGQEVPLLPFMRTVALEHWLRGLHDRALIV